MPGQAGVEGRGLSPHDALYQLTFRLRGSREEHKPRLDLVVSASIPARRTSLYRH